MTARARPSRATRVTGLRFALRCRHEGRDFERLVHSMSRREAPVRQGALPDPRPLGLHDEDRPDDRPGRSGRVLPAGGVRRPVRLPEGVRRPPGAAGPRRHADPRRSGRVGGPFHGGHRPIPIDFGPRDAPGAREGRRSRGADCGPHPRARPRYRPRGCRSRLRP